jgi:hypothetical protein
MAAVPKGLEERLVVLSTATILDALGREAQRIISSHDSVAEFSIVKEQSSAEDDHWVASVVYSAAKTEIYFRVHFSTTISRRLVEGLFKEFAIEPNAQHAHDYFSEYCNQVVGCIKSALHADLSEEDQRRVFVPAVAPSYDRYSEVPGSNSLNIEERWWQVAWPEGKLLIYASVKGEASLDIETLRKLEKDQGLSIDDKGNLQFFKILY